MKRVLLHIITIALLCLQWSCTAEVPEPADGSKTVGKDIVIRLDISSRAEGDIAAEGGTHVSNLKVWMVKEGEQTASFYKEYDQPKFDEEGICTLEETVYVLNEGKFSFYVLSNSNCLSGGTPLDGKTTVDNLKAAYFTQIVGGTSNLDVPMYGEYHGVQIQAGTLNYNVTVPITRMLSKVELFFAKTTNNFELEVNSATLSKVPEKGFVVPRSDLATAIRGWGSTINLSATATTVGAVDDETKPFDDDLRATYTPITLSAPFIFENPYGNNRQAVSLEKGHENGYVLHIYYKVGGQSYRQDLYLPWVERNTVDKIYCLVDEKGVMAQLNLKVLPWNLLEESWEYTEQVSVHEGGQMEWTDGSYNTIDNDAAQVVLSNNGTAAECKFHLETPVGATWHAFLIPVSGDANAFAFEGESSGKVGEAAMLKVKVTNGSPDGVSMARLQIMVRNVDGTTIVVKELTGITGKEEYILVQNL